MRVAVTAVGPDRPGIVASVTRVLHEQGANIEDSRMAILGGHFAMLLIVALEQGGKPESLEDALGEPARALGLMVSAREVPDAAPATTGGPAHVVSVYGADRPGIVAGITSVLARFDANITDLSTRVVGEQGPVYVMILEVSLPPRADAAAVERALREHGDELNVEVSMHPMDADTL